MTVSAAYDYSALTGMTDLLRRLDDIETKCLGKSTENKEDTPEMKDKFLSLKASMTRELADMKTKIGIRRDIIKSNGTNHEVIQLTSQIRVAELKLKEDLIALKEIYRRQCDGAIYVFTIGGGSRPSQDELSRRYDDMDRLASQMEEARKAFRTGQFTESLTEGTENVAFRNQLLGADSNAPAANIVHKPLREGELDNEEKDAMNRWSDREKFLDEELVHVSIAVDRLRPLAEEIHATGQKQERLISMLNARVDKASSNLKTLNERLKRFVDTNNKSTFVFRIVLILVLLGLGAYIYLNFSDIVRIG